MTLSPSRPLRRWSMRAVLLGALVAGVAFARHRTISRHEIDLRTGLTAPVGETVDGIGADDRDTGHDDDSDTDHTDSDHA